MTPVLLLSLQVVTGAVEFIACDFGAVHSLQHELYGLQVFSLLGGAVVTAYTQVLEDQVGSSLNDDLVEGLQVELRYAILINLQHDFRFIESLRQVRNEGGQLGTKIDGHLVALYLED